MLKKDLAICIRATDYSETSQILTLLTRDSGKISAIAKGSKRPKSSFDGPVEMFSFGRIVFAEAKGARLFTLTEFEQQVPFAGIGKSFFSLNCSLFAAELVNLLTDERDGGPGLFEHFLEFLKNTSGAQNKVESLALLILFQLALLKEVGLGPMLKNCANCKVDFSTNWLESYFSSGAGGLICKDCEGGFADKIRLSIRAAGALSNLSKIADAKEATLNEVEKILVYYFTELIGKPPKMAKHILKG